MRVEDFWHIIEKARLEVDEEIDRQCSALKSSLLQLESSDMQAFETHYYDALDAAYRQDLWAAAYLINDGCSDDGFDYFRDWLIAQGESVYRAALRNPDSLAAVITPGECEADMLRLMVVRAYEEKFGQDMPVRPRPPVPLQGEPWDEEALEDMFPQIAARIAE